jgi:hypothetical protein
MRRNTIVIYGLLVWGVSSGLLSSCKKDGLLNQAPPTSLSDANYWSNLSDLENYMNNLYSNGNIFPLYIGDFSGGFYTQDALSDNMVPTGYEQRLNGEFTVAGSGGYADWASIRDVNYFLANYARVNASRADVSPYVGEAHLFRAMLYFTGLKNYGDLPWISKPLNVNDSAELYATRLPRNIVADSIVSDLDSAIADLPVKSSAQQMRVYREYAEAFKGRVCLYEGTWEKYHQGDPFGVSGQDGTAFLQMAADAAEVVMHSGTFALDNVGVYHGYWSLFNQTDYTASKEVIFWGASTGSAGNGNNDWQNLYQGGSYLTFNLGLSQNLINDYLCLDGKPTALSPLYKGDDSLVHLVSGRDPRLSQVLFLPGDTVTVSSTVPPTIFTNPVLLGTCTTGYQLYKGLNTDPYQNPNNPGPVHSTDGVIYMRYAEVLLIYAEAKAELGTLQQADVDASINLLRDRVGMARLNLGSIPSDPHWIFPGLSPVINEVRRERRVELACEGFRFDDICRWAAAGTLITGWQPLGAKINQFLTVNFAPPGSGSLYVTVGSNVYVNGQGYIEPYQKITTLSSGYKFNVRRDYLLPIDQQDLNLNAKLTQNPGW